MPPSHPAHIQPLEQGEALPRSTAPASYPVMESPQPLVFKLEPSDRDLLPYALLPPGFRMESLEPLNGRHQPRYREGLASLSDIPSLHSYLCRFASLPNVVIYVDDAAFTITAILDDDAYAAGYTPRRLDRAMVKIKQDARFETWKKVCSERITQKAFIRFVEMNESHFLKPSGSEMRTLAAQLEVKKDMFFTNAERMNGAARDVTLSYKTNTTESNEIKFPSDIFISIPVFAHQKKGSIPVKIFFELTDGQLFFTLRIPDENAIVEAAWEALLAELNTTITEAVPILRGCPPSPPTS